jgi:hypothetical protein
VSEHTPQHQASARFVDPDRSGADPTLTGSCGRRTGGCRPTVWRTARTSADAGRTVGARLACRLVSAYSRPGDTVVDCINDHALTTALPRRAVSAPPRLVHRRTRPARRGGRAPRPQPFRPSVEAGTGSSASRSTRGPPVTVSGRPWPAPRAPGRPRRCAGQRSGAGQVW